MTDNNQLEKEIKKLENLITDYSRKSEIADARTQKDIDYIKEKVGTLQSLISSGYVTQTEFEPVKRVVYGLVALILVGVVGAIMALILKG